MLICKPITFLGEICQVGRYSYLQSNHNLQNGILPIFCLQEGAYPADRCVLFHFGAVSAESAYERPSRRLPDRLKATLRSQRFIFA
jgi:hypothetical protein